MGFPTTLYRYAPEFRHIKLVLMGAFSRGQQLQKKYVIGHPSRMEFGPYFFLGPTTNVLNCGAVGVHGHDRERLGRYVSH
jgi:hypothetical protein